MGHVTVDFVDQVAYAAERIPPDRLLGDQSEPALHLIEPTRVGGRVVDVEAATAREPSLDPGMFLSGVVVGDQMHREFGGNLVLEMVEEADELLMPVARFALGDD